MADNTACARGILVELNRGSQKASGDMLSPTPRGGLRAGVVDIGRETSDDAFGRADEDANGAVGLLGYHGSRSCRMSVCALELVHGAA